MSGGSSDCKSKQYRVLVENAAKAQYNVQFNRVYMFSLLRFFVFLHKYHAKGQMKIAISQMHHLRNL